MSDLTDILKNVFNNLKQYSSSTFVIKCDGQLIENEDLLRDFVEDVVALKTAGVNVIIVHDGINIVNSIVDKFSIKGSCANISSADQANIEMVEMILTGHVSQKIVSKLNLAGSNAIGISGKDANFMVAKRSKLACYDHASDNNVLQFGFYGDLALINPDVLLSFEDNNFIPVVSPIALGDDNRTYKIDSNDVAAAIAAIMSATKLIFITDNPGIKNLKGNIEAEISFEQVKQILQNETKESQASLQLKASLMAYEQSIDMVHIINGNIAHALMLDLFTNQVLGTKIK